jgi:hypothetical protein
MLDHLPANYHLFREYQPWGKCEAWRNDYGDILYRVMVEFDERAETCTHAYLTSHEMAAHLQDCWQPPTLEQCAVKDRVIRDLLR